MRKSRTIAATFLVLLGPAVARADTEPELPLLPAPPPPRSYASQSLHQQRSRSQTLLQQRAQDRARQRALRLEARAWYGISTARPNAQFGCHATDVNGPPVGISSVGWQPRW